MEINIPNKLHKEIKEFCDINSFDLNSKIIEFLVQGFNIAKYGISPFKKQDVLIEEKPPEENKRTKKPKVVEKEEINQQKQENIQENIEVKPTRNRKVKIIKS